MPEWNTEMQPEQAAGAAASAIPAELGRAGALHLLGKKAEAVAELNTLLERRPDYAPAYRVRAMLYMELGEAARALEDLETYHRMGFGDARSRLARAQCLLKAGRWEEAAEHFQALLDADPNCDDAVLGLGLAHLRLHHLEEALALLERYLDRHPDDATAQFGRAVALHLTGDTEHAIPVYERLASHPEYGKDCLVNLCTIYRQRKDGDALLACSQRLLEIDPESAAAHEAAAYGAFLKDDYAEAARHLEALAGSQGLPVEQWMNLGLCRRKEGNAELALQAYEQALARQPDLAEAHLRKAELLAELGREEDALNACRAGIEACPDAADLYFLAVHLHEKAGRREDAEALLEVLALRQPGNADIWFRLGNMKYDRHAFGEAADAYRAALAARPDWAEAWLNLGLACYESGRYEEAETAFQRALNLKPGWETALRAAAVNALRQNHMDLALQYHRQLIDSGHSDPEVLYNTAMLHEQLGQKEEAELLYRQALEWKPDFAEALIGLGYVLERTGRPEEARQCWARAMEVKPELAEDYFGLKS
jgi:tetratricopeptide (TPR) repeat protein